MAIVTAFLGKKVKAIGNYLGILDSLEIQIKKLISSELNSAIIALKQAQNSETESISLLREARSKFNKAIYLEQEERLVASYLGLALCHYQLEDITNAANTLKEFAEIEITINWQKKLSSSLKGECGFILSDTADKIDRILPQKSTDNKIFKLANNYLKKISTQGENLSKKNYYQSKRLMEQIKEAQEQAKLLAVHLPDLANNKISSQQLLKLTSTAFIEP